MARDHEIQEILLRVDLVDLIGAYLKLTRAGRSFKGLCPFHNEKTPSFHVYPSDGAKPGFYHCFGCKKGGDALSFLTEREGLSFSEALDQLAKRAGLETPRSHSGARKSRQNRFEVLNQCQAHFRANLRNPSKGTIARDYLKRREIDSQLSDRFGLGYALDSWDNLAHSLGSNPETLGIASQQGLIRQGDKGLGFRDFFRNRLIFPIHNPAGEIIAFAGRDLSGDSQAKYMNTPETDLFKKGRVLYGLHQARNPIRERKRAIVVEGYFDVLRMHAHGFEETVAPMGTALTSEQLSLLGRLCEELILLFDGDNAGHSAAMRSLQLTWDLGILVRVAHLPAGQDPDEFLLCHPREDMQDLLNSAPPSFTYLVDGLVSEIGIDSAEKIRKVTTRVFESISTMKSHTQIEIRLKEFAERIGIPHESLKKDYERSRIKNAASPVAADTTGAPSKGPEVTTPQLRDPNREREARKGLYVLLLQNEGRIQEALGEAFASHTQARHQLEDALSILRKPQHEDDLALFLEAYLQDGVSSARKIWSEKEQDPLVWEVEAMLREDWFPEDPLRTLMDYTNTLKGIQLDRDVERCKAAFINAERAQDWAMVTQIADRLNDLIKQRDMLLSRSREVG